MNRRTPHPISIDALAVLAPPSGAVVVAGNFDGVHAGHRTIIDRARRMATALDAQVVALTFEPHTRHFLDQHGGPELLSTWKERMLLLGEAGADRVGVLRFDDDLRVLSPSEFLDRAGAALGARGWVFGWDHRFGRDAEGTPEGMSAHCGRRGWSHGITPPLRIRDQPVSSTRIRHLLGEPGGWDAALELLGAPWTFLGEVVRGDGRGKLLGFSTANLEPSSPRKLLPLAGVYAGFLRCGGPDPVTWADVLRVPAVVNIGSAPTFRRGRQVVEVHVLEAPWPDYGQTCRLELTFRLRQERTFDGPASLRQQIARDVREARQRLAEIS